MRLGEGEMKSGGFSRPSILPTMAVIFGAIFVDQGLDAARTVIGKLSNWYRDGPSEDAGKSSKTLLQEYWQGKRIVPPVYTIVETRGSVDNQDIEAECAIEVVISVRGSGKSSPAAEQMAAARV